MFKRIICLIFICSLVGCEKETLVPTVDTQIDKQQSYDAIISSPKSEANQMPDFISNKMNEQNSHLGNWTGDFYDLNEYSNIDIRESKTVSCYAEVPFFIDGMINSTTLAESYIDLWLGLNDVFIGLNGIVNIDWKVNGSFYLSDQKIKLSDVVEGELISITCDVYSTDGVYIYLSTIDFDLQVVGNDTSISESIDFSNNGLTLQVINGETVLSDCGLGAGAFTIIVP